MNGELRNEGQLDSRGDFRFDPGVKLSVAGLLQNSGTVTTDSFMQVAGGRVENAGTLNNGGELSVLDGGLVTGGVVNNGGIVRIAGDGTMTDLVLYRQNGSDAATTVNGRLHAALVQIDAGVLQGSDRLEAGEIVIGANATVGPGNSPGTLTLAGTVLLDGALELEIGPGASDHLVVEGGLFFGEGARVRYSFIEGFLPEAGRRYTFSDFVTAGLISGLDQVSFETSGLPTGSLVAWDGSDFSVTAVPEPQTWAMFAAGLSVFAFAARRRRAR
jgi:autotransporter passenger strand-loop-strand repeat protein